MTTRRLRHAPRAHPRKATSLAVLFCLGAVIASDAVGASARPTLSPRTVTSRTKYVLGYSVDRRPIIAWRIAPRHARRSILVVGSIAGDEPGGIAVTTMLASQAAITNVNLWLIPDANPDGILRGTRGNAHGVDLNRNFPYRWHSSSSGSRYYSGPRPTSEPEARAIVAFVRRIRPELAIWLHQPYGLIDDSQGPHWAELQLAGALKLPLGRLPDYPGSAIGWNDHIVPRSAFDLELAGGQLSRATVLRVATAIRSLARRLARDRPAH